MLGDPLTPQEAVDTGLANAVLPASEVLPHARRMAERFNQLPPSAVKQTKQLMRRWQGEKVREVIAIEGDLFGKGLRSPEAREAFQAFFEKRRPDFSKF